MYHKSSHLVSSIFSIPQTQLPVEIPSDTPDRPVIQDNTSVVVNHGQYKTEQQ